MKYLDHLLRTGGSAYRVDAANMCLIRRINDESQAAKETAVSAAPSAAEHLEAAWVAAYGISPDHDKAVRSAINAIEAFSLPIVSADNPQPTLTKSLATLRKNPSAW